MLLDFNIFQLTITIIDHPSPCMICYFALFCLDGSISLSGTLYAASTAKDASLLSHTESTDVMLETSVDLSNH